MAIIYDTPILRISLSRLAILTAHNTRLYNPQVFSILLNVFERKKRLRVRATDLIVWHWKLIRVCEDIVRRLCNLFDPESAVLFQVILSFRIIRFSHVSLRCNPNKLHVFEIISNSFGKNCGTRGNFVERINWKQRHKEFIMPYFACFSFFERVASDDVICNFALGLVMRHVFQSGTFVLARIKTHHETTEAARNQRTKKHNCERSLAL